MSGYRNSEGQTRISSSRDFRHFHNSCTADVVIIYSIPGVGKKNNNLPCDIFRLRNRENVGYKKYIINLTISERQAGVPAQRAVTLE